MNIGFIGYGEAAFNISLGLKGEGVEGIRANDAMMNHEVMGKQVHARAEQAGVTLVESAKEVAQWADVLFAAVPSSFTMDVCNEIKSCLRPGQLYVDVSASTPATKVAIWEAIKDTGVLFADAAMLGSLPKDKHKVPITASGNGAAKFQELMTPYGMKITLAGEKAGSASAIKLVRSIYMKGIAGLINIFNPELVVLGGPLSETGEYLLLPIKSAVKKYSLNMVSRDTQIKLSKLGNTAGVLGACLLSRSKLLGML